MYMERVEGVGRRALNYSGLGQVQVFRTAAESAKDINMFESEVATFQKTGGLLNLQTVFKYTAAKGRLKSLQDEVDRIGGLQVQLNARLEQLSSELEGLGITGVMDYVKMGGIAIVGYFVPGIGMVLQYALGESDKKRKMEKAKKLLAEAEMIAKQLSFWEDRKGKLSAEGERLAVAFEKGEQAIAVSLTPHAMVETTKFVFAKDPTGTAHELQVPGVYGKITSGHLTSETYKPGEAYYLRTRHYAVPEPNLATIQEMAARSAGRKGPLGATGQSIGTPVGFQTIYSPVLDSPIVMKAPTSVTGPQKVVGKQLVYGGLSGPEDVERSIYVGSAIVLVGAVLFLLRDKK